MFALLLAATAMCHPMKGVCEAPLSADVVADNVGVNVHLHFGNTVYGNFPLIQGLLTDLGVRHVRDGLIDTTWQTYYQEYITLGKLGIKGLFIADPKESNATLVNWPSRVPGAFEGYEAPNEYDNSGDPNWAATLNAFVPRMYNAVKSNPATAQYRIVGPALIRAADYAQIPGLTPYFDFSNMHNYFGGHNPGTAGWGSNGYGSIAYNMNISETAFPGKPILTTETGYLSDPTVPQGIPESVEGKYAPRVILEQASHSVTRTYIYELIEEGVAVAGTDNSYGLARNDGSRKPAFVALKNLISTLSDPGSQPLLQNLQFSFPGASSNVHHLLLQKRDGSYYLAFWLEESDYDGVKNVITPVTPEKITFQSPQVFKTTQLLTFGADGSVHTATITPAASIPLTATDCVSILRLQ